MQLAPRRSTNAYRVAPPMPEAPKPAERKARLSGIELVFVLGMVAVTLAFAMIVAPELLATLVVFGVAGWVGSQLEPSHARIAIVATVIVSVSVLLLLWGFSIASALSLIAHGAVLMLAIPFGSVAARLAAPRVAIAKSPEARAEPPPSAPQIDVWSLGTREIVSESFDELASVTLTQNASE